jgi:hypothetical protein
LIRLPRDFDLLSGLLHAVTLSFEGLLLGGIAYLLVVARPVRASTTVAGPLELPAISGRCSWPQQAWCG